MLRPELLFIVSNDENILDGEMARERGTVRRNKHLLPHRVCNILEPLSAAMSIGRLRTERSGAPESYGRKPAETMQEA